MRRKHPNAVIVLAKQQKEPIETILSIGLLYRLSHLINVFFYHSNNDIRTI